MKNGWGYEKDNGERADPLFAVRLTVDLRADERTDDAGEVQLIVVVCVQLQVPHETCENPSEEFSFFLFTVGDWGIVTSLVSSYRGSLMIQILKIDSMR